ncbi:major facilitator superfamily transporter [Xylariaceae sp. FL0594]|nr:major facilitator superfamily transporter [Xylariaceae sp. FL0594]
MDDKVETSDSSAIVGVNEEKRKVESDREGRHESSAESIWPAEGLSKTREVAMVFVVCMAQFCTQSAFASVLLNIHTIGASFSITNPAQLPWLVSGYSLTVGTFILFSGRLGDAFGYKRVFLVGLGWFSIWSVVCGLSVYSNFVLMVFARVLQGIGPAICLPNALAILGSVYPPSHKKAMIFALFGATAPTGAVVGSAIAALFSLRWWPWFFFALALWLVVLIVLASVAIPDLPRKDAAFAEGGVTLKKLSDELDLPGAVTGVVSLVLFNFAWNQAPIAGWKTPETIVPLVLGLAIFGLFTYVESRVASKPLLPFDAINADVAFVLGVVACGWATFGIWILYYVQILQSIRHLTSLLTVAWMAPLAVSGAAAALITGLLLGPLRVRPPVVMTLALAAFTIGITLIATVPPDQIYWGQIFVCNIVIPFGMDMSFPAATLILSDAVKREHQGIGASLVNTVVNYGISLGVGFAGTVEANVANGDQLRGYRGGMYFGIGISTLGLGVCVVFLIRERFIRKRDSERNT